LELVPTSTHEPNGGIERAGQEVITRAIKMRTSAFLPENLWPETTGAATRLYNISPSRVHNMRTPNEVFHDWFRRWFRWYNPTFVNNLSEDLRPNWNGIYAYGCRAYPLDKDRELGRRRRDYKVQPRGHLGYLVGYRASNIYRIWIPSTGEVLTTRNVTFDEYTFYDPSKEHNLEPAEVVRTGQTHLLRVPIGQLQDAGTLLSTLGGDDEVVAAQENSDDVIPLDP
jgi:hypothetical protein